MHTVWHQTRAVIEEYRSHLSELAQCLVGICRQWTWILANFAVGLVSHSRENYGDALDAGRGMIAMSQNATPRNLYESRVGRGSSDYGFPPTHSSSSSISSSSYAPSYYGSADGSVTDYSSNAESVDSMPSRTLPRPSGLMSNMPPAPQTMMGQFSSKVSSSTQKKHKCKVCEKRFTRPSSLQTHVYSHTGEKRKVSLSSVGLIC